MNKSSEHLRKAVEAETLLFCQAMDEIQHTHRRVGKVHDDLSLYSRETHCGAATAFVSHGLKATYDIDTTRLYTEPPLAPRLDEFSGRRFSHVILRQEDALIDPTYGQLYNFAGIRANHPNALPSDYPDRMSLVVDINNQEAALEPLAESLDAASRSERAQLSDYAPFRGLGKRAILAVLSDIYNPEHQREYPVYSEHPSFDRINRLIETGDSLRKR